MDNTKENNETKANKPKVLDKASFTGLIAAMNETRLTVCKIGGVQDSEGCCDPHCPVKEECDRLVAIWARLNIRYAQAQE